MGILADKSILVTGVTAPSSIAYKVVEIAQAEGAQVLVSNFGRALGLTKRVCARLDPAPHVIELDVTNSEHLEALPATVRAHLPHLDGIVHSIAYADPAKALGGAYLSTEWEAVSQALRVSTYSYVSLAVACRDLLRPGASVVGLTFDATVSWPVYDWMGVAKAGLESASRYLARYLGPGGVRSNLVSAGPLDTIAKMAIPGVGAINDEWRRRAPLGWEAKDLAPTAKAVVALLSDWFPATTGEVVHVDGGLHSTGC